MHKETIHSWIDAGCRELLDTGPFLPLGSNKGSEFSKFEQVLEWSTLRVRCPKYVICIWWIRAHRMLQAINHIDLRGDDLGQQPKTKFSIIR